MILKYRIYILFIFLNFYSSFAQVESKDFKQLYTQLEQTSFGDSNFESLLKQTLELAKPEVNQKEMAQMYDWAINLYSNSKDIIFYSNLYEKLGRKEQNLQWIIRALQGKAYAYGLDRNYSKALVFELEALHIIENLNEPYLYFSSLYSIGTTKLYMGQYNDALEIFKKTTDYFEGFRNYNHILAYFNSKRLEALCYFYLNDFALAQEEIDKGFKQMYRLKKADKPLEISYFKLTQAMLLYKQGQYDKSINCINEALPLIINNEDFANEYLAYLYLGKNEWEVNRIDQAIANFKKIDHLYKTKSYITFELKKAYEYLILDANNKQQLKEELYYTNQLLAVTSDLQSKYTNLSNTFFSENEIQKANLLKNKKELTQTISNNKKRNILLFTLTTLLIFTLVFIVYRSYRKTKKLRLQFEKLKVKYDLNSYNINTENTTIDDFEVFRFSKEFHSNVEDIHANDENIALEKNKVEELPEKLVKDFDSKLTQFEKNKEYLQQDITLAILAERWNTNRSYLSKYFNQYKLDNFNSYINNLRIDYAIVKLHSDSKFRKYSIDALALEFGFRKRRHFSDVFTKKTGITPSYYIQQLEKDIYIDIKT